MPTIQTREDLFSRLILSHRASLLRIACQATRSREEAEDVVQETLLRAFRYRDTFRGGDARPWLNTILRHQIVGAFRKRSGGGRDWTLSLTSDIDGFDDLVVEREYGAITVRQFPGAQKSNPETVLQQKEEIAAIRAAITRLPDMYRRIIVLSDIEGWTYQDIAAETGLPLGTVRSPISRARHRVRKAVAAYSDRSKAIRRLSANVSKPGG
jgi:RNA polymerase sigma-70 factor (ECF subfamily)